MLGTIIGDMVGSLYEAKKPMTKDFPIIDPAMRMTDDSYMTMAVAEALMGRLPVELNATWLCFFQDDVAKRFVSYWQKDPYAGYGKMFWQWCMRTVKEGKRQPGYHSFGNGAAMRIAPVAYAAKNEEELKVVSRIVTEITHNHPEAIKGAEAVALCVYLALHGASKEEIRKRIVEDYYPEIEHFDFADLIEHYSFHATCQDSVPQAIYCFLISTDLEDTIRNCVAIGGDTDTVAAMAGGIAEAYYQKDSLSKFEEDFLYWKIDKETEKLIDDFYRKVGSKKRLSNLS